MKKRGKKLFSIVLSLIIVAGMMNIITPVKVFASTNYYVDEVDGDDGNTGLSPEQAWQSLEEVTEANLVAGDIVYLKRGCTWEEPLYLDEYNTDSVNMITIDGDTWGTGNKAIINGGDIDAVTNNITGIPEQFTPISGWRIRGVELRSSKSNPAPYSYTGGSCGVFILAEGESAPTDRRCHNLYIENCTISEASHDGILLKSLSETSDTYVFNNVNISGCTIFGHDEADLTTDMLEGIHFRIPDEGYKDADSFPFNLISGFTIENCEIYNTLWDGIDLLCCEDGVVQNCSIHDCGKMTYHYWSTGSYGCRLQVCQDVIIQNNNAWNQLQSSDVANGDGGGFAIENGCSRCVIQYNTAWDNYGGSGINSGSFSHGAINGTVDSCIFRFNYFYNDAYGWQNGSLFIHDYNEDAESTPHSVASNNKFYNNTCITEFETLHTHLDESGSTGNVIANNIFYVTSTDTSKRITHNYESNISSLCSFYNNIYYHESEQERFCYDTEGGWKTFAEWESLVGGQNEKFGNPFVVTSTSNPPQGGGTGDIHLQCYNPCIDAGTSITGWLLSGETLGSLKGYYNGVGGKQDDGYLGGVMEIGAALCTETTIPQIMTHNAEDEFSLQQGRGGWYNQYWNGSSYSDMEWLGDYNMWQEPGSNRGCMIQDIYSRPDGTATARKWVAPSDGTVLISGTMQKRNSGGNGVAVRILQNSTELWSLAIGSSDTAVKSYNDITRFKVEEGDALYFRVEGDDPSTDEVEFKPQIDFYAGMVVYSADKDFTGTTQGINNWHYQYWDGDSYENMIWDSGTSMWKKNGNNCMVQAHFARPDGTDYSVRKWVAPADGSVSISGTVEKRNAGGNGVSICIKHNSSEKWRKSIPENDVDNPYHYDMNRFQVSSGDAIYFIVEGDNAYYDEVEMYPEVVFYSGEMAYKASTGLTSTWEDNQWTFQYWDGDSYENMVWNGSYNRWEKSGSSGSCMIQSVYARPDGNYAVRKWTAPSDGMVTITGMVKKRNIYGDGVTAKIKYGTTEKYSVSIAQSDTSEHTYSPATFYMSAGESLYFSVEGNDPSTDEVEFDPTVTFNAGLVDYQASTDYSATQGTKHWSYKYWDGDSYENMEWSTSPARWIRPGSSGSCMIESSYTRPDGNYAVRKWTAPCDGIVTISGDVTKRFSGGDGVDAKIRRNSLELWSVSINQSDTSTHGFTLINVYVSAGDALYFSVEGNSSGDDEVAFDPLVSFSAK